jgi:hypothetical protein
VGTNYQFGPSGTLFLKPVTMNLPFSPSRLPSGTNAATDLQILTAPDGSNVYTSLGPAHMIDDTHVGATTLHFSMCVAATVPKATGDVIPGQCVVSCTAGSSGPMGTPNSGGNSNDGGIIDSTADGGARTGTGGPQPAGTAATCGCQEACNGTSYQLVCDGNNCSCIQNGVTVSMVTQGPICMAPLSTWTGTCKFPSGGSSGGSNDGGIVVTPDGGGPTASDDGGLVIFDASVPDSGSTCAPHSCSGGLTDGGVMQCSCNETCMAKTYTLSCTGGVCSCSTNGAQGSPFNVQGGQLCTAAEWTMTCGFPN